MAKGQHVARCVGTRIVYSCVSAIVFLIILFLLFNLYAISVYVDRNIYEFNPVHTAQAAAIAVSDRDVLKSTAFSIPYMVQQLQTGYNNSQYSCFKFVLEKQPESTVSSFDFYRYTKKPQLWQKLSGCTLDQFTCIDANTLTSYAPIFEFYSKTVLGTLYICIIAFIVFFVTMHAFCFTWCGCRFSACGVFCGCIPDQEDKLRGQHAPPPTEVAAPPAQPAPPPGIRRNSSQIMKEPSMSNLN